MRLSRNRGRLLVPIVIMLVSFAPSVLRAQQSSALASLPESPPAKQTIYYVGKESTTDFNQPGMGLHLQYFPAFDLESADLSLPTNCDGCIELTPDFENFKHQQAADLADRTFSPDAPGVGVEGDADFEPPGVKTAGGVSGWDVFTLPGGRSGLSGTTRDPASCGSSNNFVNQLRINSDSLQEFCLNIITDNTQQSFDPDIRLEVRSDTASFDLQGDVDFTFDGQTDMYTFRYRGMQEGDRIKIRIADFDLHDVLNARQPVQQLQLDVRGTGLRHRAQRTFRQPRPFISQLITIFVRRAHREPEHGVQSNRRIGRLLAAL